MTFKFDEKKTQVIRSQVRGAAQAEDRNRAGIFCFKSDVSSYTLHTVNFIH